MKKLIRNGQTLARKAAFVATGAMAASSASALDSADITTAFEGGNEAMTAVVGGLIAMAAIAVGVGLVLGLMRKS